jgi:hypothetical protein
MNNPEKPATCGEQDEEKQNKNKERLYVGDIPHRLCNRYPARLLFSANSSILQLHHDKNKLIFNDMMVGYGLY